MQALTPEQKKYIDQVSIILAQEDYLALWYVTNAKPLGEPKVKGVGIYEHEPLWMRGRDGRKQCKEHLVGLDRDIQACLAYSEGDEYPHPNRSKVILFPDPMDDRIFFLRANFVTPIGTIAYDPHRRSVHSHTWVLTKQAYELFDKHHARTWRLFPFILQATAFKIKPDNSVFFDGSISGDSIFKAGNKNQLIGLDFVGPEPCRLSFEDPADPACKGMRRPYSDRKMLTEEYTGYPSPNRSPDAIGKLLFGLSNT